MLRPVWQWFLEPYNQQMLLGSVIAFLIGLIVGRWTRKTKEAKGKSTTSKGDEAFFKGIQYILSNDHDQAIEEFTKSVQINSDTIETYVALGNLYRSKGDIDRSIRIRQSIILRPNIDEEIKLRALFDLGLDYRKGGFLNRALSTYLKVAQKDHTNVDVLEEIKRIYEEMKDWENAYQTQQKIARLTKGDHRRVLAHHLVEMGKVCQQKGNLTKARSLFNGAISIHNKCVDAYLHLGDLFFTKKEYKKAFTTWKKVVEIAPQFTFLAYRRLEGAYLKMKNLKPVKEFLEDCAQSNSDAFTHMALARYLYNESDIEGALKEVSNALKMDPCFWEARRFKGMILITHKKEQDIVIDYGEIIEHLNVPYLRFQCHECGFQPNELQWQCPQCKNWDTIHLMDSARAEPIPSPASKSDLQGLSGSVIEK